ncbi:eukaryotic translation initiation factor 3 subunit G-like protein [Tanacetum coccineum]
MNNITKFNPRFSSFNTSFTYPSITQLRTRVVVVFLTLQRLSDAVDEEDTDYSFLLPQDKVTGPDKDGIKKTVECYFNDAGQTVKKTTTTRVTKLGNTRISKTGIERRKSWVKFGDAVHDNAGDNLTVVSREVIAFERPNAPVIMDGVFLIDNK